MALGVAHVPEGRQIFTNMTLRENLLLGAYHRKDKYQVARDIEADLELFPRLRGRLDESAYNLSGGELQMLAILRGMIARPRLLLLDEPSEGLAPQIVEHLGEQIGRLKAEGLSIILAEQNLDFALSLSDRLHVVEKGIIRHTDNAAKARQNRATIEHYLRL